MEVMSESELNAHWQKFADYYVEHFSYSALQIYKSFLPFLSLGQAQSVIEVGCGGGHGIKLLLDLVPETCKIWGGDLNEEMLDHARQSLPDRVSINCVNCEQIPNEDASADRFVANLIVQICTYPEKVLSEAFRVLSPGGIAAFTVWGHRLPHNYFDLALDAAKELGFPTPNKRSNYHLNDPEKITAMVKEAGFQKSLYYFYSVPWRVNTVDEIYVQLINNPSFAGMFNKFDADQQVALKEKIREGIVARLEVDEQAFTFESLVIIAYK